MSSRISLLPDHVANQIAAGEVIQRPASVVKELLENAVDAKASTIQLIVKDAGKTLIQVIDNGLGMNRLDILLAFERHATSKINLAEDLFALNTKGFRGEALASIAAISNIETHTRTSVDDVSHCLKIEGSKIKNQSLSTQPQGTSIAVKSLFFNNGSELFDLSSSNLRKRIITIFGSKWDNQLIPIEEITSLTHLKGFVLKPEFSKKTRGQQFFFVNNRFIKSPFLNHAVNSAFEGLLRPGYHPGYFLYLSVDPKTIDINIHPTKTEIKFEEEQSIYAILRSAIKHSLGIFQVIPTLDFEQNKDLAIPYNFIEKTPLMPTIDIDSSFNPFKDKSSNYSKKNNHEREGLLSGFNLVNGREHVEQKTLIDVPQTTRVFQLFLKYIVCPLQTSILLIDQRRAHQRILYERFLGSITAKTSLSQQLLFPLEIKINPQQTEEFNQNKDILLALGFQMKLKDKVTLEVMGCPEHCPHSKIESVIETLLSGENSHLSGKHLSQADQIAKTLSKTLSIKSGEVLTSTEQQTLLDDFFGCKETSISPFNKSIFISLQKTEIEQKLN